MFYINYRKLYGKYRKIQIEVFCFVLVSTFLLFSGFCLLAGFNYHLLIPFTAWSHKKLYYYNKQQQWAIVWSSDLSQPVLSKQKCAMYLFYLFNIYCNNRFRVVVFTLSFLNSELSLTHLQVLLWFCFLRVLSVHQVTLFLLWASNRVSDPCNSQLRKR